jgi:hypothetical protein
MQNLIPRLTAIVVAAAVAGGTPAHADSANDVAHHFRTTDRRLASLLQQGRRESATFRTLVARLVRSDVIVYLQCQGYGTSGGRLTFVGSGGGFRYVLVRLDRVMSASQQIALLGHELQHAVEIADAPDIVDAATLAQQYRRFGHVKQVTLTSTDYDTIAAVETGYQVLRELQRADDSE